MDSHRVSGMNPYAEIARGETLVGRDHEKAQLQRFLEEKSSVILVSGERGVGKTALLYAIIDFPQDKIHFFFDATVGLSFLDKIHSRLNEEQMGVLQKVRNIFSAIEEIKLGAGSGEYQVSGDIRFRSIESRRDIFEDLTQYCKKIKKKIVILIENAHNLSETEQYLYRYITHITDNFYVFMEVPDPELEKFMIKDAKPFPVDRLSPQEIALICERGQFLSDDLIQEVVSISEGIPYYAHWLCWILYVLHERGKEIEMKDFLSALKGKTLQRKYDRIHIEIFHTLDGKTQDLLLNLAIAPRILTEKAIEAFSSFENSILSESMRILTQKGIVLEKEEVYYIYHSRFRDFLKKWKKFRLESKTKELYLRAAQKLKSDWDSVLLFSEVEDKNLFKEICRSIENEDVLLTVGEREYEKSNFDLALACYERGKELDGTEKASFIGNLGVLYRILGETEKALKALEDAMEIHKEIGNRLGEANQLGNIGLIYRQIGETEKALKALEDAMEIHKEIGNRLGEANQLGNIGLIYRQIGETEKALKALEDAMEIDKEIGNRLGEASTITFYICLAQV